MCKAGERVVAALQKVSAPDSEKPGFTSRHALKNPAGVLKELWNEAEVLQNGNREDKADKLENWQQISR